MRRLLALLLLMPSCGGGGVSADQAQTDCDTFIGDVYCPKVVSCDPTVTQDACVTQVKSQVPCFLVQGENGHLQDCQAQVMSATCTDLAASGLPPACRDVFTQP